MKTIHDEEFDDTYVDCVAIDEDDMNNEFCRVASDRAWAGVKLARAMGEEHLAKLAVDESKINLKLAEAQGWLRAKTSLEGLAAKKSPTLDHINAVAVLDTGTSLARNQLALAREKLIEMSGERELCGSLVSAIEIKSSMLISLGAHMRKEMVSEPAVYN